MVTLGLISSFFGGLTFALLLWLLNAGPDQVRIGWFVESAPLPDHPGYTQKDILLEDWIVICSRREKG
jgi:hypothetical protein